MTRTFVVRRGENEDLRVEYEPAARRATASREKPSEAAPKPGSGADSTPSPKPITNSIGMKLVLIPAGEFLMGSPDSDKDAQDDEKPQHRVRITQPFYLGATEVTQGQYRAVTGQSPSNFKGSDDLPVEHVSWNDAIAFCDKLNEREKGQLGGGATGCRPRPNGSMPAGPGARHVQLRRPCGEPGRVCLVCRQLAQKTHPVGQKRPNALGLYDMHGNVWEWCQDVYDKDYYGHRPVPIRLVRRRPRAVRRGGSLFHNRLNCRSAARGWNWPDYRNFDLGLRVARGQYEPTCKYGDTTSREKPSESAPTPEIKTDSARRPKEVTNSIGMKLALIAAGSFDMGWPDSDQDANPDEKPQHPVRVLRPFYLGIHEVTQSQYRAVTGATPSSSRVR